MPLLTRTILTVVPQGHLQETVGALYQCSLHARQNKAPRTIHLG